MCILYSLMEPQLHIAITALHIGRNAKSQKRSMNSMTMPKKSFERRKNMSKAIFGSHQSRGGQNVCTGWQVLPDPSSSWLPSPTLHSVPDNFFLTNPNWQYQNTVHFRELKIVPHILLFLGSKWMNVVKLKSRDAG